MINRELISVHLKKPIRLSGMNDDCLHHSDKIVEEIFPEGNGVRVRLEDGNEIKIPNHNVAAVRVMKNYSD